MTSTYTVLVASFNGAGVVSPEAQEGYRQRLRDQVTSLLGFDGQPAFNLIFLPTEETLREEIDKYDQERLTVLFTSSSNTELAEVMNSEFPKVLFVLTTGAMPRDKLCVVPTGVLLGRSKEVTLKELLRGN